MTETKRIRWHTDDDGETTGYVGSLDRPVFRIWPPDDDGDCLLFLYLAGHAGDLYHGATIDGQQAEAERLLEEFVSSLGAVFGDEPDCPAAPTVTIDMHRWYAIVKDGGTVLGVIGVQGRDGLGLYESKEEWERVNG